MGMDATSSSTDISHPEPTTLAYMATTPIRLEPTDYICPEGMTMATPSKRRHG